MKKLLLTSILCLIAASTAFCQTTPGSTPSLSGFPVNVSPDCQPLHDTWKRVYLSVETERRETARMLTDSTIALQALRREVPKREAKAYSTGRKSGFWSGVKWGAGGIVALAIAAKLALF